MLAAGVVGLAFLAAAAALIVTGAGHGTARADQNDYHLPVIRQFAAQLPRPDLSDYNAAMTPGYHLLMAAVARYGHADEIGLRFASSLFTLGLLLTFCYFLSRHLGVGWGIVLSLPLLCSQYIFTGGVWLVPHNAAWWCVLICLLICLRPVVDWKSYIGAAAALLLLVLFRQIHIWAAALLCVAAWMESNGEKPGPEPDSPRPMRSSHRVARLALMALAALPAVLALLFFYRLWHGTVPPMQRSNVGGGNAAVPAFFLALAGIFGLFFCSVLRWRAMNSQSRTHGARTAFIAGLVVGFLIALLPHTDYDRLAGRWGGLWNIARHIPAIAGRSPLIIALAALGGAILCLWLWALPARPRWIFLVTILAFVAAHSASGQAWQRYDEPFLLILFPLMVLELNPQWRNAPSRRIAWIGPILLAGVLAIATVITLR